MRYLLFLAILAAGCAYQPAFGDLTCAEEGAVRDGQRCEDGVWVGDGEGDVGPNAPDARVEDSGPKPVDDTGPSGNDVGPNVPDASIPDADDTNVPDTDVPDTDVPDMEPDACVPESDAEFCGRQGAVCGSVTGVDDCGVPRTVASCGTCGNNATCTNTNVCECLPGFELDAGQCKPPCEVNNPCDINATCSGDRVCTCNDGYVGDGVTCSEIAAPSIVATATHRATTGDLTTGNLTAQAGDLYVAIVGINGSGSVEEVTGLGLSWTRAVRQCSVINARQVEVWYARGTANGSNGAVSLDVTGVRTDAAVVVYQITNVANTAGPGSVVARNGRGDNGCGTGSFHDSYNYTVMRQNPNSLILSALVSRGNHNPAAAWTEDQELQRGQFFSLSTMHQQLAGGSVTVSGSMRDSYWVSVTAEIFGN